MPKSNTIPISKQLASIKALGKGSELEKAIATAILVYNSCADNDGKVSKGEVMDLMPSQFQNFTQDDAMRMLDLDGDGEVDFMEFIEFITEVTTELQNMYIQNVLKYKRPPKFGAKTRSEKAIVTLIKVFYKYAGKGGDLFGLETKELRQLLRKEMPTLHPCLEGNNHFKEILSNLESRRTGTVDFKEFMSFVANFAVAVEFSFVNEPETDED
ncbi:sentan isoform X1 [Ranitomeya imitator]|uniref:sentan isoform X1 n=1 Tax=Ranitomeya imitator TaxID=111125 RepID=UPI0037E93B18